VTSIAVLPGSIRTDSVHRRLAHDLVERFAEAGVDAEVVDLARYPMAIYHGDDEAANGVPDVAVALHDRLASFDGLVVVTPEYNGGPPALLKNAIDWATRVDRAIFKRHLVGIASATPGGHGGKSVLTAMRAMFDHMRLEQHGDVLSVPNFSDAFDEAPPRRLVRTDAVESADAFVASYSAALSAWVESGRDAVA
jgi:NAD(P)H-dependent FMN reductase